VIPVRPLTTRYEARSTVHPVVNTPRVEYRAVIPTSAGMSLTTPWVESTVEARATARTLRKQLRAPHLYA
jgi:hypothetical protein